MPLTGVAVDAEISNLCARVTVTQHYVNHEAKPIEAVYVFPLDEASAVSAKEVLLKLTYVSELASPGWRETRPARQRSGGCWRTRRDAGSTGSAPSFQRDGPGSTRPAQSSRRRHRCCGPDDASIAKIAKIARMAKIEKTGPGSRRLNLWQFWQPEDA